MIKPLRLFVVTLPLVLPLAPVQAQISKGLASSYVGIARVRTVRAKGKNFSARATYPGFRARTPLVRFANARIRSDVLGSYRQWLKATRTSLQADSKPIAPYEFELRPILHRYNPRVLISMNFNSYEYTGGAHGMSAFLAQNYAVVNGKPKEITLGDLFRRGTAYRPLVEHKIFAKLKKNKEAAWVQDGSVKTLTTSQFNNFTVSRSGLTWIFNPYEMGPYAAGIFEVTLTPAELGAGFKRELLR
jgi:hypothetical protein